MSQQLFPDLNFQPNSHVSLSRDDYRNRQLLLNKVKSYWIRGILEKSLHGRTLIELGLEERLDAIECSPGVAWETADEPRQILPSGTRAIACFDELAEGRTLLILGEPGSGKTTTLLEIARELIDRALADIDRPIPVIFNLSSWNNQEPSISNWLIKEFTLFNWLTEELYTQYQIPKEIGQNWLNSQQLLLMLDGLDEVSEQYRSSCVQALNDFSQEYGQTEIVACSRIRDYEFLGDRLRFQRAISLHPLTRDRIDRYLDEAGSEMAAIKIILQQDAALQEFVNTPFILTIFTLAYQGISPEDLLNYNSTEESRQHLFNVYIQRMLTRQKSSQPYSPTQSIDWLSEMAYRMSQQSQTTFFIEQIQPNWLPENFKIISNISALANLFKPKDYQLYSLSLRLILGLSGAAIAGVFISSILAEKLSWIVLVSWLALGGYGGAKSSLEIITPVDQLKWSWKNFKKSNNKAFVFLCWLFLTMTTVPIFAFVWWIVWSMLICMLITGIGLNDSIIETTVPNQGIWKSFKNALRFGLTGIGLCVIGGSGILGLSSLLNLLSLSLFTSGLCGLGFAMNKGGKTCLQHFVLRCILYRKGVIPWNYARFLDYAVECGFLYKVGGGYIFIHRLLQESFVVLGRKNYWQTIPIIPNQFEGYVNRGNARFNWGDYQGAIADYTEAIQIKPDLAEAYAGRSLARYGLGDYQGVLEDYEWTFQLNPNLARAMTYVSPNSELFLIESEIETIEKAGISYFVIILNHNLQSIESILQALTKYIPEMTDDRAWELAFQVLNEDRAIVWSGCQELATLYRQQLSDAGLTVGFLETAETLEN